MTAKRKAKLSLIFVLIFAISLGSLLLFGIQWYDYDGDADDFFYTSTTYFQSDSSFDAPKQTVEDISVSGKTIKQTFTLDKPFNRFYFGKYDLFKISRMDDTDDYPTPATYKIELADDKGNIISTNGEIDSVDYYYNNDGKAHTYTLTITPTNVGAKSNILYILRDKTANMDTTLTVGDQQINGELDFTVAKLAICYSPKAKIPFFEFVVAVMGCLLLGWLIYLIISPIANKIKKYVKQS